MAKYLNETGLSYFYNRLKTIFGTPISNLETRAGQLEDTRIKTISINGAQSTMDSNKNVNITMPTKLTDLNNDGNFVSDASYVHTDSNYTSAEKQKLAKVLFDGNVLSADILPSYVDDVVEAYARSGVTKLSANWLSSTQDGSSIISPATGKIYVLLESVIEGGEVIYEANTQFRWGGTAYVKLADGGVSAITTAEIDEIVSPTTP